MMPSLLRYFTIVGGLLFAGLIGLNALLEPGGPGPTLVKAEAPKPAAATRLDPRASKVERLRAEEAAAKAAAAAPAVPAAEPAIVTAPAPAAPQPVQAAQPAPPQPAPVTAAVQSSESTQTTVAASLIGQPTEDEAAQAVRAAQGKMKAEKARKTKARLARERARAREEADSRTQDQIYYGQRQQFAQPQPGYAYAPRQTFGPFGQGGGWGRGW